MKPSEAAPRLTQLARGGGCACKIPPGDLERLVDAAGLRGQPAGLLVGVETGDDGAVVRLTERNAVIMTADFFTPVVDDPFDWGRIAAANALSDIYAMGGTPLLAVNLLAWPRDTLGLEIAAEVLKGGALVCQEAQCCLAGGHSIVDAEPKYGLAVTGTAHPDHLFLNSRGRAGLPLTLTKPLGLGVLNNRHKVTGERFDEAVETMALLNRDAATAAHAAGVDCATDVTGFGLLGHLYKLCRASGVSAEVETDAVPILDGSVESAREGYIPGGSVRNLKWVRQHLQLDAVDDETLILMADAQTSGGLLLAGEIPGHPVIGRLTRSTSDGASVVTLK